MTDRKPLPLMPAMAVFVGAIALLLVIYIAGYLWLCGNTWWDMTVTPLKMGRGYDWAWQAAVFKPAGWFEGQLRGIEVEVYQFEDPFEP